MTIDNGEALELALGLLRAPALRGPLRARPLPGGVGEVLAIASGSIESARRAAQRTGYGEAELVEASRFYVQQVLLADDADAYRVLGASRDAEHATLRDHHRHLLRWLHPDRSQDAQWDSALATRVNQAWNHFRTDATRAEYDATLPPEAALRTEHSGARAGVSRVAAAATPYPSSPAVAAPAKRRLDFGPIAVGLLALTCAVLAWLAVNRQDIREDIGNTPRTTATVPESLVAVPQTMLDTTESESIATASPPAAEPALAGAAIAATTRRPEPVAAIAAPTKTWSKLEATAETTPESPRKRQPAAEPVAAPLAAPLAALGWADEVSMGEGGEVAAMAAPTAAGTAEGSDPEDPLQLFQQAEDAIRSVTGYLSSNDSVHPIWLDMPTGLEAAGIRNRLQARHRGMASPRLQVDAPNWTLGATAASMLGAYRLDDRRDTVETGMLRVELTRLDRQWRVASLHLEPAR